MLRHKNIERICCLALVMTMLLTCLYMAAAAGGLIKQDSSIGYENRLFDQSYVHTIDIVMDDWQGFLDTCTSEEYTACTLVIDGESYKNVAIRGKGNTSLSSVASFGNDRYSFKVEFDHYQTGKTYHGLDKLSLNNLIYDNTYMKDYFAYTLMNKMGVASPLCSFVEIRVNGETFGTYLAVEGVEDSFLQRNYGTDHGELYKPDTMNFGGGRGNGREFNMEDFMANFSQEEGTVMTEFPRAEAQAVPGGNFDPSQMLGGDFEMPEGMEFGKQGENRGGFDRDGMGMSSSETTLQYVDDNPESYEGIFSSAKTNVDADDQTRLIAALKKLSEGDTSAVDQQAMLRYLAVHDFLQNGDSYTGSMVHNYYLYEENGVLSMIPWDYNLAYGTFQGSDAQGTINSPIDSPVNGGTGEDRPMVGWIFASAESTAAYHEIYAQFIAECFDSGWFSAEIDRLTAMLTPYVATDPTAFCTLEEFETAVATLKSYGELRAQSVTGQLEGSLPSTTEGQRTSSALVATEGLNLSAMGSMGGDKGGFGNMGNKGNMGGERTQRGGNQWMQQGGEMPTMPEGASDEMPAMPEGASDEMPAMPEGAGGEMPTMPEGASGEMPAMPGGMGGQTPDMPGGNVPDMAAPTAQASAQPTDETAKGEIGRIRDMNFPAEGNVQGQNTSQEAYLLLAICLLVLLAALIVAKVVKNNR